MYNYLKILILLLVVLSLTSSCNNTVDLHTLKEEDLPLTFDLLTVKAVHENESCWPLDLNHDGIDEIVTISNRRANMDPSFISINSNTGGLNWLHNNYRGMVALSEQVWSIDDSLRCMLYVSEMARDTCYFHLIDWSGKNLLKGIAAVNPHTSERPWWCSTWCAGTLDVNADGHRDIICGVRTGYAYQPRAVFAYDVHNRRLLWRYATGFVPSDIILADADRDGRRDIIMGSSAPANGISRFVNGTDDATAYVTILDSTGRLKYSHRFAEGYNQLRVLHLETEPDSAALFFFLAASNRFHAHQKDMLGILANHDFTPKVLDEFAGTLVPQLNFIDADGDQHDDLLLYKSDGYFEIRNLQMKILCSRIFPGFLPSFVRISDADHDSSMEIIVVGSCKNHNYILILDARLHLRGLLRMEYSRFITDPYLLHNGKDASTDLCIQNGNNFYTLKLRRQLAAYLPLPLNGLLLLILLFSLVVLGMVIHRTSMVGRTAGLQALQTVFNNLRESIIVLDQNGRVIQCNQEIIALGLAAPEPAISKPFQQLFSSDRFKEVRDLIELSYQKRQALLSKEMILMVSDKPVNLLVYVSIFPLGGMPALGRIVLLRPITEMVEHERALAWAGMAQRLAHELKSPLSTVRLSAQQIQANIAETPATAAKSEKYLRNILQQVDRLSDTAQNFLKFASLSKVDLKPLELNTLLVQCIQQLEVKLIPTIKLSTHYQPGELFIQGDQSLMSIAIINLLDNSLNAMIDGGFLDISTRTLRIFTAGKEKPFVEFRIRDTGKGMSKESLKLLFEPFFSQTSGGTGLGMVIVRKIIQDHNGRIIVRSAEGKGTLVIVRLPAWRES